MFYVKKNYKYVILYYLYTNELYRW